MALGAVRQASISPSQVTGTTIEAVETGADAVVDPTTGMEMVAETTGTEALLETTGAEALLETTGTEALLETIGLVVWGTWQ